MAKGSRRDTYLKDPVGSHPFVTEMPSGLIHTADSLGGDRNGRLILRMGSPGDPLEKSPRERSGYMGKVPSLASKFFKKGQS